MYARLLFGIVRLSNEDQYLIGYVGGRVSVVLSGDQ